MNTQAYYVSSFDLAEGFRSVLWTRQSTIMVTTKSSKFIVVGVRLVAHDFYLFFIILSRARFRLFMIFV